MRFLADVDGEGDPCALAERRASTFSRRKIILTSTPTIKDMSRIETEYEASDQASIFCAVSALRAYAVVAVEEFAMA
jgi:phage terminase large subunit GpA-like protein